MLNQLNSRFPPYSRFQTIELSRWIIQIKAEADEQQDTVQGLQISFRSGEMAFLILPQ